MSTRYAKSLRAALRIEPRLARGAFEMICIMLEANPSEPPKDTTKLLELLQEAMLRANLTFSEHAKHVVAQLNVGGKGVAIQRSLLGAVA